MSDPMFIPCPKCKNEVEFNFANNNGYVGMCGTCQKLFYYCAMFSTIDVFEPTKERYDKIDYKDFYYESKSKVKQVG